MKPTFTDLYRFPVPYTPAASTDIAKTFKRERERLKQEAEARGKDGAEQQEKKK